MQNKQQFRNLIFRTISRATTAVLVTAIVLAMMLGSTQPAPAQTFKVIHNFSGGADGGVPYAGLTVDSRGNLYGTTTGYNGAVFKLSYDGSDWVLTPLYNFQRGDDGYAPWARVIFGPNGNLYGTTTVGGGDGCQGSGCGTIFNLRPTTTACRDMSCRWQETVLYRFTGGSDGYFPFYGDLVFDQAGNMYGTTCYSGVGGGYGVIYELVYSGGTWKESTLFRFGQMGNNGLAPTSGVLLDQSGNFFGTTVLGGWYGQGAVFQFPRGGAEKVLYSFRNEADGRWPGGGLISDQSRNLYGTTTDGGSGGGGTVFMLSPSQDGWVFTLLYSLTGASASGPYSNLAMDAAGNLYGTTYQGGAYGRGSVFKLTRNSDGWIYTSLHDFTRGIDGGTPMGSLVFDANDNLYGTTAEGGAGNWGVVWEITP